MKDLIEQLLLKQAAVVESEKEIAAMEKALKEKTAKLKAEKAVVSSLCVDLNISGGDVFCVGDKKYIKQFGNNWPFWMLVEATVITCEEEGGK